jgi:hypothetical protein
LPGNIVDPVEVGINLNDSKGSDTIKRLKDRGCYCVIATIDYFVIRTQVGFIKRSAANLRNNPPSKPILGAVPWLAKWASYCFTLNPQKSTEIPVSQAVYRLFMRRSLW